MTILTAAEVRTLREGLGLTADWLADHLGIQTRTVQRWEAGHNAVAEFAADELLLLEAQAAEQVTAHVEAFTGTRVPAVLAIDDTAPDCWPAGWQRRIAFRVRQQVPGLRIIANDEEPPTG